MADDSTQRRIGRQRAPRVHIRYDVEDGGATESRELPLVAGVVSDLSGDGHDPVAYAQRQFVEVEPDGVEPLMARIAPTVKVAVDDRISGREDSVISAELNFRSLDDFSPLGVATQIPQTRKLLETRGLLADLYGKVESSENLDGILGDILADEAKQSQLRSELGLDDDAGSEDAPQ